jgi:hypothetical protein
MCIFNISSATTVLGESLPDEVLPEADDRKKWLIDVGYDGVGAGRGENKPVILFSREPKQ